MYAIMYAIGSEAIALHSIYTHTYACMRMHIHTGHHMEQAIAAFERAEVQETLHLMAKRGWVTKQKSVGATRRYRIGRSVQEQVGARVYE